MARPMTTRVSVRCAACAAVQLRQRHACRCGAVVAVRTHGRWRDDACLACGVQVVRQTLLHWAYQLTEADFGAAAKRVSKKGAAYVPREQLTGVMGNKRARDGGGDDDDDDDDEALSEAAKRQRVAAQLDERQARAKRRAAGPSEVAAASKSPRGGSAKRVSKPAKKARAAAPLSAYEQEREVQKARNERKLVELGLL